MSLSRAPCATPPARSRVASELWPLETIGVVMHCPPVASLLAENRGGANVHLDLLSGLGHAIGTLHAHQVAHISGFNEATIVSHQGSLKSHGGFLGKLLHDHCPPGAESTGGA